MNDKTHFPILTPERVEFTKKTESKKCAFDSLTELLFKNQSEVRRHEIFDALIAREKLGYTYIGNSIALPRAHLDITHPRAALLGLKNGIKLSSADKKPIRLFIGLLIPSDDEYDYSSLLSEFNKKVLLEDDMDSILKSENKTKIANYFNELLSKTS